MSKSIIAITTLLAATALGVSSAPAQSIADLYKDRTLTILVGYSAGLGVDVALMAGLFLRAEWEYARFTGAVDTSVNTVRAGLGYKF